MRYFLTGLLLFCIYALNAQQFGGNPFSTRWQQMNTDTARIIFPAGLDSTANRISNIVHNLAGKNRIAIGNRLSKINIVLQPQTVISNGYVGLGPFRSEFYLTPPADNFDMGNLPWPDLLALHEYRHVQQYNNFYNGASKGMRILFGQEGYALAINAAIPNWFFEGDAVYQETALSPQGRGRMPYFLKAYPALWRAAKKYSWMKLRNGSYKDYVPNHYDMGYLLVNYGYEKYGAAFWKNVTKEASAYKGLFYPMQKAVKKYSGLSYTSFTKNAFAYYKNIYGTDKSITNINQKTKNKNEVINYFFPFQIAPDSLLYLQSSYKKRPAFYIKDNSGEHLLSIRDISIDNEFSYKNGKIVYAAYNSHPRWQWINYSVIKILDIKTGSQKTLQQKTKYFSPDISEDGQLIAANKISDNGRSSLVIINASTGSISKEIASDSIDYFSTPRFINNDSIVTAIRRKDATIYLAIVDINKNSITSLTPNLKNTIGQLYFKDGKVFFTASQGLKDEIFSFDIYSRQLKKLNTNNLNNYNASVAYDKINWTTFTANGYKLESLGKEHANWGIADTMRLAKAPSGIVANTQTGSENIFNEQLDRKFDISKYFKFTRPFNFHSWRPNYENPLYSFTVYGNNILNTVRTQLEYVYNENEKTNSVAAGITYAGLFPHIGISSQYTPGRHRVERNKERKWNQLDNSLSVSLPLSWVSGRTYNFFNLSATYVIRNDFQTGIYKDSFTNRQINYLSHTIGYGQQVQRAVQHIFPRWGYYFSLQVRNALITNYSWQGLLRATVYLPGFLPNHHIVLSGAMQQSSTKSQIFSNRLPFARGFNAVDSNSLQAIAANYHLPIAYPDWGVANIFYLQRVRANLFYDFTQVLSSKSSFRKSLQSTGAELYFDTKWWNQHPITLGMRGGYLLTSDIIKPDKKLFFEFILPVSLIPR